MIEKKEFGRTGHKSTRALFGAAAFWRVNQDEADRTMAVLEEYGVNHIDTAASYGDSELRLGPWLKHNRKRVFLATKTEKRGYREAKEELSRSLDRLRTDSVDLWQMHVLIDPGEWERAMSEDGALRAFVEAREEGLVRFLGVTGHGVTTPWMHLKSLARFPFDSVLLPYNYPMLLNPDYRSGFERLSAVCAERNVALQAIKTIAIGPKKEGTKDGHATWYEPLTEERDIEKAIHWALGNGQVFINTAGDIGLLPLILKACSSVSARVSDDDMGSFMRAKGLTALFE
jgi:aryl-alcohol dehydrogenase-like predicted oxidoreductase